LSDYLDFTIYGKSKFVEARLPTASEVDARIKDLFVDSSTGVHYICIDDTPTAQQWQGTNNTVIPLPSVTSPDHPDLLAFYTMDNISGSTLIDESSNSKDATLVGSVPTAQGVIGDAILTSTGNYANTTDVMGTPELGISGWINISSLAATNSYIFGRYDNGVFQGVYVRLTSGGQLTVRIRAASGVFRSYQSATGAFVVSTDYHLVFNFAADATLTMFRGGTPFAMTLGEDVGGLTSLVWPAGVDSWLGGTPDNAETATPGYFTGALDQFRYFDRILTAPEVTTLFNEVSP
jgi:hypothetical protein